MNTKQAKRVFYNTAWFWKVSPLEMRNVPFSEVIELANESARINNDIEKQNGRK